MKSFCAAVGVFAFAALLMLLANGMVWGQTGTSTISGVVTDPQGAFIAGANVTLTDMATNFIRKQKAGPAGVFTFALIPPGDYRVEVEAQGFKRKVLSQVHAVVGTAVDASVALEVGPMAETVIVEAGGSAVHIDTQDATLGNYVETVQITQLPLEARALVDLLSLQPGATREGYVTGARADQSNITLDGVDINNAQTSNAEIPRTTNSLVIGQLDTDRGNITTGPVLRLNTEAIEEFRITTANATANQGHSSGGQVNLVTKSGSNNWHGAAFEFYRGTIFRANDWFSNRSGVPRTPLVRNTFGGALGGPIIKDKAFFFYSYESRHDATAQAVTRTVPLASLGRGIINYTYCTDSACNSPQRASLSLAQNQQVYQATGINQLALNALAAAAAKYPANDTSVGDQLNTGGFRFNATTPVRLNSHVAKLDFNLTNNQSAFVRMNVIYDHQTLPAWLPDAPSPLVWSHPWG
ncbi:MAG TPA: carboxypeptidase-like regulatory domain-containing protein, partial [Candidatus Acidoferrales bacterium]|nr:carboxypeptidase-like regulatory domain-containing protein [Candidatus Acidoferrales bacterium]